MTSIRARLAITVAAFGGLLAGCAARRAAASARPRSRSARAFDARLPFADNVDAQIFFVARLPRVLAAALVGGALAAAGVVFQALFRNPLASPDTLGVSAGAALGADAWPSPSISTSPSAACPSVPLASLAGSLGALGIVYTLATARRRGLSTTVLLLAGVTMTAFFSALIMFTQYLADFTDTVPHGSLADGNARCRRLRAVGRHRYHSLLTACARLLATLPRALDLLSLGTDAAAARGVDVTRAERIALVGASLATGAAVSIGGPVGFVGIVVPHMVRLMVGSASPPRACRHRRSSVQHS